MDAHGIASRMEGREMSQDVGLNAAERGKYSRYVLAPMRSSFSIQVSPPLGGSSDGQPPDPAHDEESTNLEQENSLEEARR